VATEWTVAMLSCDTVAPLASVTLMENVVVSTSPLGAVGRFVALN
jgi:hypothetical protein